MNDDELRQRLHSMPEPATTIDVDAVVADARRRRRPKVIGTGVAVGAACLAFLAPVVVPGLLGPDPVTSTLQDQGAAEQAPAAPGSGGDGVQPGSSSDAGDDGGAASTLSAPIAACAAMPLADDLALGYSIDDGDGTARVVIQNLRSQPVTIAVGDVGVGEATDDTLVIAPEVEAASAATGTSVTLEPMASHTFDVAVLPATSTCAWPDGVAEGDGVLTIRTIVVALAVDGVPMPQPVLPGDVAPVAPLEPSP